MFYGIKKLREKGQWNVVSWNEHKVDGQTKAK